MGIARVPMSAACHRCQAAWAPMSATYHRCQAAWSPMSAACHRCQAAWSPMLAACHRCQAAWAPMSAACHRCQAAWAPMSAAWTPMRPDTSVSLGSDIGATACHRCHCSVTSVPGSLGLCSASCWLCDLSDAAFMTSPKVKMASKVLSLGDLGTEVTTESSSANAAVSEVGEPFAAETTSPESLVGAHVHVGTMSIRQGGDVEVVDTDDDDVEADEDDVKADDDDDSGEEEIDD
ncbi:hypothetical protein AALP_AA2G079800 [Arabis alpina]|uniref:Uncharacterized protein n=1 Tax=Arabis alpina TaxID=50452 RepID=A0A087HG05_ARAAL|nr:hypothetical protein AALP_AA2G079800 [Arabis alpina]